MARPTDYRPEYCDIAVKILADGESLAGVCAELDISRPTLYSWCKVHAEFDDAINRGLQKSQRSDEQLGKQGIRGDLEKFAQAAWIFNMKNRYRDDYAEEKKEVQPINISIKHEDILKELE